MRFSDWIEIFGETFVPHATLIRIPKERMIPTVAILLRKHFGKVPMQTVAGESIFAVIGDRFIEINTNLEEDLAVVKGFHEINLSFGWRREPPPLLQSDKDEHEPVLSKMRVDTLEYAHKMRDFIRELSQYNIAISYVPIGGRRDSWYRSVIKGSGYVEYMDNFWVPHVAVQEIKAAMMAKYNKSTPPSSAFDRDMRDALGVTRSAR